MLRLEVPTGTRRINGSTPSSLDERRERKDDDDDDDDVELMNQQKGQDDPTLASQDNLLVAP